VLCVGASHALTEAEPPEHTPAALQALRRLVTPGGRVLLGEGFWQRPPADAELAAMWPGASAGEYPDLARVVELAIEAGFRPAWIEVANAEEWDDFESGYQADEEEWLAAHPGHPRAAQLREQVDQHRSHWLRGYRGIFTSPKQVLGGTPRDQVRQGGHPAVRVGAAGSFLAVQQGLEIGRGLRRGRSGVDGSASLAAISVKTRTPYQAVSSRPWPASRPVRSARRSARAATPILLAYWSEPNASAHAAQSPSSPGRMASASPLRTSSDTIPPGAVSPAMARRTGSGSAWYISTPWQSTAAAGDTTARCGPMLDKAALDPHPGPDLSRLGGKVPFEPGQQVGRGVNPGHLVAPPRQPQGLRPLTAAKINDRNGRWWQFRAQLPGDQFLAHHVPELAQPRLPAVPRR
jgi:hypothetical protein